MSRNRCHFRPCLECLERRDTPSNFTVTFANASHTLTILGDSANNNLTIEGTATSITKFTLSSATDTFNGQASPYVSPIGVKNITVSMLGGDDSVILDNTVPITVDGNLSINGGDGANSVTATDLTVENNFSITNGIDKSGAAITQLTNLNVYGSLRINNGTGNTSTTIDRNAAGQSTIVGNLRIVNRAGADFNQIEDTNVGGNVAINNGHANTGGNAGTTWIFNTFNTSRSVIRGNVSVSYLNGTSGSYDGIWDTEVLGNVTFNHASGTFTTNFDGFKTALPVIIRGSLALTGTGNNTITIGTQYKHTGMLVGKALNVTVGGSDTLTFNNLVVEGATHLTLGTGNDTVTIDASTFAGTVTLLTGSGTDLINLATTKGSSSPTTFEQAVVFRKKAGLLNVVLDGMDDANQALVIDSTFVIHFGKAGGGTISNPSHETYPFDTSIELTK
jgi:hypothetical protein